MKPMIKAKLPDLEPGQPFTFDGKRYVMPDADSGCWAKNVRRIYYQFSGIDIFENFDVELILDQKEFREMESGQEFYDEHGLLHRRTNCDSYYFDINRQIVSAFCYHNNELSEFGMHDPVFVVVKK